MTKERIYIRGCVFAVNKLIEKGSKSFAVNVEGETKVVDWTDIIEYLIQQYEEDFKNEEF